MMVLKVLVALIKNNGSVVNDNNNLLSIAVLAMITMSFVAE
jgi:hypothetical protein